METEALGGGGERWALGLGSSCSSIPTGPSLPWCFSWSFPSPIPTTPLNRYKESLSAGWIYQVQRQGYPKSSSQAMGTMKSIKSRGLEGPPSRPGSTTRLLVCLLLPGGAGQARHQAPQLQWLWPSQK